MAKHIRSNSEAGFTIIEILIAITVIGLISSFAIPSYQSYLQRGRLVDVAGEMIHKANSLEQHYLDHQRYSDESKQSCILGNQWNRGNFKYECTLTDDAQAYELKASSLDNLIVYSINQLGERRTLAFPDVGAKTHCWVKESGGSCW